MMTRQNQPIIGCYYFPNYHTGDPRNDLIHGKGWSEWNLVKSATPRFPGHHQPNIPLWGFTDEKNPQCMAQKIDAAVSHGVNCFLFDWYYYNDGPFLNRALEEGLLNAPNLNKIKFATMWANHNWTDIHPCGRFSPRTLLFQGAVTRETYEKICSIHISKYFSSSSYLKWQGKPYFSIYDLTQLLQNFGSVQETRKALEDFRTECKAAGFPGLHINAIVWGTPILPGEKVPLNMRELIGELGFDSITSYVWVHHVWPKEHLTEYSDMLAGYLDFWKKIRSEYGIDYYPNITMGWDASPRTIQTEEWDWNEKLWYPFGNMIAGNTPEAFGRAAEIILKEFDTVKTQNRMITLNSWNEWTEGSYIEPDIRSGLKYLEALKQALDAYSI